MDEKGVTFERVKNRLAKQEYKGASDLSKIEDIPAIKIFELLNDLKRSRRLRIVLFNAAYKSEQLI